MSKWNENRSYGIELEVATSRTRDELAEAIQREFISRGIRAAGGEIQQCHVEAAHLDGPYWRVVRDTSIGQGWEVVSPPLRGVNGRKEISAVVDALKRAGCDVNKDTGFHVHHDAHDMSANQVGTVFGLYATNQAVINFMVSPSRREGHEAGKWYFCKPLEWETVTDWGHDKFAHDKRRREADCGDDSLEDKLIDRLGDGDRWEARYHAVNIIALEDHGTLEFRQHQGTLNLKKIWAWINLTQSFLESAKERQEAPAPVRVTGGRSPRGEFDRMRVNLAIDPCYHARKHPGQAQDKAALKRDCKPYQDAYRFFGIKIRNFATAANVDPMTLEHVGPDAMPNQAQWEREI